MSQEYITITFNRCEVQQLLYYQDDTLDLSIYEQWRTAVKESTDEDISIGVNRFLFCFCAEGVSLMKKTEKNEKGIASTFLTSNAVKKGTTNNASTYFYFIDTDSRHDAFLLEQPEGVNCYEGRIFDTATEKYKTVYFTEEGMELFSFENPDGQNPNVTGRITTVLPFDGNGNYTGSIPLDDDEEDKKLWLKTIIDSEIMKPDQMQNFMTNNWIDWHKSRILRHAVNFDIKEGLFFVENKTSYTFLQYTYDGTGLASPEEVKTTISIPKRFFDLSKVTYSEKDKNYYICGLNFTTEGEKKTVHFSIYKVDVASYNLYCIFSTIPYAKVGKTVSISDNYNSSISERVKNLNKVNDEVVAVDSKLQGGRLPELDTVFVSVFETDNAIQTMLMNHKLLTTELEGDDSSEEMFVNHFFTETCDCGIVYDDDGNTLMESPKDFAFSYNNALDRFLVAFVCHHGNEETIRTPYLFEYTFKCADIKLFITSVNANVYTIEWPTE